MNETWNGRQYLEGDTDPPVLILDIAKPKPFLQFGVLQKHVNINKVELWTSPQSRIALEMLQFASMTLLYLINSSSANRNIGNNTEMAKNISNFHQ